MVMGYHCGECEEVKNECDIDDIGERICPDCESWVSGITGRSRKRHNGQMSGNIQWDIVTGYGSRGFDMRFNAFDWGDAASKAAEKVEDDEAITEIRPTHRKHRGR